MSLIRLRLALALGVTLAACSSSSTNPAGGGGSDGGNVTARCDPACTSAVSAGCKNSPTKDGCMLTCKALASASNCHDLGNKYFDCVDANQVKCNAAGEPFADGCSIEYLNAVNCAVSENPNPDVVGPCAKLCDAAVQACPSTSLDECKSNCMWAGATGVGCDGEWETYLACANNVNLTCLLGYPLAPGCGALLSTYTKCINAAS